MGNDGQSHIKVEIQKLIFQIWKIGDLHLRTKKAIHIQLNPFSILRAHERDNSFVFFKAF